MMRRSRMIFTVAAVSGAAAAVLVVSDLPTGKGVIAQALAVPLLSDVDVQSRLQAQGYTNIQNLKHDGNLVTATASKDGQTTQLIVDGATGQVGLSDDDGDD